MIYPAINLMWTRRGCGMLLSSIMPARTHTPQQCLASCSSDKKRKQISVMCEHGTWHDEKWSLGLHGYQANTEDAGSIRGWDATHSTHFLQPPTQWLEVSPAQQNTPVWREERQGWMKGEHVEWLEWFLWHDHSRYLLALHAQSYPVGQSPPSRGLTSSALVLSTNPTASAGRGAERSLFSSVLCGTCIDTPILKHNSMKRSELYTAR